MFNLVRTLGFILLHRNKWQIQHIFRTLLLNERRRKSTWPNLTCPCSWVWIVFPLIPRFLCVELDSGGKPVKWITGPGEQWFGRIKLAKLQVQMCTTGLETHIFAFSCHMLCYLILSIILNMFRLITCCKILANWK